MIRLNLGCGTDLYPDWTNIDLSPPCDVIASVDKLPYKKGSVSAIRAYHVLEHFVDLISVQRELARVLYYRAELVVVVPHYLSVDAWGDPTHVRAFSEMSFVDTFWPGFVLHKVELFDHVKVFGKLQTRWMQATFTRNIIPYEELITLDRFPKVATRN
jgi:predicted SAM-dependent methyltransferase